MTSRKADCFLPWEVARQIKVSPSLEEIQMHLNSSILGETVSTSSAKVELLCRKLNKKIFGEGKSKSVHKEENKLHGKRQITLREQSHDFVLCSPLLPVTWEKRPEPASTIPISPFLFSKFPQFFTAVMHAGKRSRKGSSEPRIACQMLLKGNNLLDREGSWIWVSSVFPERSHLYFIFVKQKSPHPTQAEWHQPYQWGKQQSFLAFHFIPISRPSSLRNLKKGMLSFRTSDELRAELHVPVPLRHLWIWAANNFQMFGKIKCSAISAVHLPSRQSSKGSLAKHKYLSLTLYTQVLFSLQHQVSR